MTLFFILADSRVKALLISSLFWWDDTADTWGGLSLAS
jgi:hypothetical protein